MSPFLLNLLDRVGWTVLQALGGTVAAGQTASALGSGITDWRASLVGAATAGVLCLLKVFGVRVSKEALDAIGVTAKAADSVPAIHNTVVKLDSTQLGGITADVAEAVLAKLREDQAAVRPASH